MTKTAYGESSLVIKEADIEGGVAYTAGQLAFVADSGDNAFNGAAVENIGGAGGGIITIRPTNVEVSVTINQPTGTKARNAVLLRVTGAGSPTTFTGYGARENVAGDPSVWEIFKFSGYSSGTAGSITSLGTLTATTVSAYPVKVSFSAIGNDLYLKVWNSSLDEPPWTANYATKKVTDSTYATNSSMGGMGAFGLKASGDKTSWSSFAIAPIKQVGAFPGGSVATTTDATSFSVTNVTAKAGDLLCISTANSVGSGTANAVSTLTAPSGITVNTTPFINSTAITNRRFCMYTAKCTADVTNGTMTFDFGAGNTQSGFFAHIVRVWGGFNGASDGSTGFNTAGANVTSATTSDSVITGSLSFSNPRDTSGFVASAYRGGAAQAPGASAPAVSVYTSGISTPSFGFGTEVANSNDTTPAMTFDTSSSSRLIMSVEVYVDDWYESTFSTTTLPSTVRTMHNYRLRRV